MRWLVRKGGVFVWLSGAILLLIVTAPRVWATGFPPTTSDDTATVTRGGTVSVLDSGATSVLANDFDVEADPLTVELRNDVRHGTLVLVPDGTFVYSHNGNNKDEDWFEYRAFDGSRFSSDTRVTIRIVPGDPIAPVIVGQAEIKVPEDESVEIRLADLQVDDPDSRYPQDFSLSVGDGENYERVGATVTPAADYNGVLSVPVQVNDGSNQSNTFNVAIVVEPVNDAPYVVGEVADQIVQEAVPFQLELAGFFADPDSDSLSYDAGGLPPSGTFTINVSTGVLAGTPILADSREQPYPVTVTATDDDGASAKLAFNLTVVSKDRADLALDLKVTPQPAQIGDQIQWEVVVENLGPADLGEGLLEVNWVSSGPALELVADASCTALNNGSAAPGVECLIKNLAANSSISLLVEAGQETPGDSTAIAIFSAEDADIRNNIVSDSVNVAAEFASGAAQTLNTASTGLVSGDLDSDGYPDLVVIGVDTLVFWNTGERALGEDTTVLGSGSESSAVSVLDWNSDGLLDVAVASGNDEPSLIYLNNGARRFGAGLSLRSPGAQRVAADTVADLDGDGAPEWVLAGSNGTAVVRNDGLGGWLVSQLIPEPARDVGSADFNQDGFMDLVVTSAADRAVRTYFQDDVGGTFRSGSVFRESSVASSTPADVNNDGIPDLLLAVDGEDLTVPVSRVLANDGSGGFALLDNLGASPTARLLAGDVNGDGVADVVALKPTGVHQVFAGQLGTSFTLEQQQIPSAGTAGGLLIDINADQSLDLILAADPSSVVEVHFNDGLGRFGLGDVTPPVISLAGDTNVTLQAGDAYEDPGATASDDVDGDLTAQITVDNTVNTAIVGTYQVSYSVADRAGNISEAKRTVKITAVTGVGGGGGGAWGAIALLMLSSLVALRRGLRTYGT